MESPYLSIAIRLARLMFGIWGVEAQLSRSTDQHQEIYSAFISFCSSEHHVVFFHKRSLEISLSLRDRHLRLC